MDTLVVLASVQYKQAQTSGSLEFARNWAETRASMTERHQRYDEKWNLPSIVPTTTRRVLAGTTQANCANLFTPE